MASGERRRDHDHYAIDMVAIMTMTRIHIEHHGHGIGITGIVIGAHVAGMFLPSPLSGWLVDRFGYLSIAVAAGVTLLAAGLIATWAPVIRCPYFCWPSCCSGRDGPWPGQWHHAGYRRRAVGDSARAPRRSRSWHRVGGCDRRARLRADLRRNQLRHPTLAGGLLALVIVPIAAVARAAPSVLIRRPERFTVQSSLC